MKSLVISLIFCTLASIASARDVGDTNVVGSFTAQQGVNIPAGQTYKIDNVDISGSFATAAQGALADSALQSYTETDSVWAAWLAATPPAYPGTTIGKSLLLADDGFGNPVLQIGSISLANGSDYKVNGVALDVTDLTDLTNALSGTPAITDITDWPAGVSTTELSYIGTLTSDIQTQVTNLADTVSGLSTGSIPSVTADPSAPDVGYAWYNSTDHTLNVAQSTGKTKFSGTYTAWDQSPTAFTGTFTDVTNATVSTLYTTIDGLTVAGIDYATAISITGGEYQKNSGTWGSASGTVVNGDIIDVRQTSSSSPSTQTDTVLTIGDQTDTFSVTTAAAGGYSNCSNLGTYELTWDGDHTGGYTTACIPSSTTTITTNVSSTGGESTTQNNTQYGTKSFLYNSLDDNIRIARSSYISSSEGYITFYIYPTTADTAAASVDLWQFQTDANNKMYLRYQGSNTRFIFYNYSSNGGAFNDGVVTSANDNLVADQWNKVEFWWKLTDAVNHIGTLGIQLNDSTATIDTNVTFNAMTTEPSYMYFGEKDQSDGPGGNIYIDDIYLEATAP